MQKKKEKKQQLRQHQEIQEQQNNKNVLIIPEINEIKFKHDEERITAIKVEADTLTNNVEKYSGEIGSIIIDNIIVMKVYIEILRAWENQKTIIGYWKNEVKVITAILNNPELKMIGKMDISFELNISIEEKINKIMLATKIFNSGIKTMNDWRKSIYEQIVKKLDEDINLYHKIIGKNNIIKKKYVDRTFKCIKYLRQRYEQYHQVIKKIEVIVGQKITLITAEAVIKLFVECSRCKQKNNMCMCDMIVPIEKIEYGLLYGDINTNEFLKPLIKSA